MIHPDMATMLAFVATDAPVGRALLRGADARDRRRVVQLRDGRRRHVDQRQLRRSRRPARRGDRADHARSDDRGSALRAAIAGQSRATLAQAIVRDGEGATKFITMRVEGGRDVGRMPRASRSRIAHSPLVKTAFFASDPNLGRIVCAIGNAGVARPRSRARVVLARRRARRRRTAGARRATARRTASA